MRRLTAIDAQFLYQEDENPAAHQHTLKIAILDPSRSPTPYDFALTKEMLGRRLHLVPPLRWRLVRVPLDLYHPVWIEDPAFDLDFHVRRMGCPAPGGDRELSELISDIVSRPLDRAKPLWELYLIEGLGGGRVAAVTKVHHALADGVASAEALQRLFDTESDAPEPPAPPTHAADAVPTRRQLMRSATADLVRHLVIGLPELVRVIRRARRQQAIYGITAAERPPAAFEAPPTRLNRVISPHRLYAFASQELNAVKAVKDTFGCTINDVVLATVAGGLRRYLARHDDLPDRALVGVVPVSVRTPEQQGTWGNRVGMMTVALRTDIDDPVERLRASQRAATAAKADFDRTRGARIENVAEFIPVRLLRLIIRQYTTRSRRGQAHANVAVSNVPGPRHPLYSAGTPLEAFFSIGPIMPGIGLNITVWSYVDQLNLSLLACRETVPDLWTLVDDLQASLAELRAAAATGSRQDALTETGANHGQVRR